MNFLLEDSETALHAGWPEVSAFTSEDVAALNQVKDIVRIKSSAGEVAGLTPTATRADVDLQLSLEWKARRGN